MIKKFDEFFEAKLWGDWALISPMLQTPDNKNRLSKQGLNILNSGCGMQSEDKQKRGEALPLGKSMKLEAPYPLGSE